MELSDAAGRRCARRAARRRRARRWCSPTRKTIPARAATATRRACSQRCSRAIRATPCSACSSIAPRPGRRTRSASAARRRVQARRDLRRARPRAARGRVRGRRARRRQVHVHGADVQGLQDGARADGGAPARATCASCSPRRRCRPPTRRCSVTSASSPCKQRVLALKSSVHFRADFQPIASEVLVVVAPGPAKADPTMFHWTRLRPGLRLKPGGPAFGDPACFAALYIFTMPPPLRRRLVKHETNTFSPIATPLARSAMAKAPRSATRRARASRTPTRRWPRTSISRGARTPTS